MDKITLLSLIESTLTKYNLYSEEAALLVYGTIIQESRMGFYRRQWVNNWDINKHALGISQVERNTFNWLKDVFVGRYPELSKVQFIDLAYNDEMAILFCRLRYLVNPKPIPKSLNAQAKYWKKVYNGGNLGSGTPEEYIENFNRYS